MADSLECNMHSQNIGTRNYFAQKTLKEALIFGYDIANLVALL